MSNQRTFFDDEPRLTPTDLAPWERDDLRNRKIARIAFPSGFDSLLDYLVPTDIAAMLEPGMRVTVPLGRGNRPTLGYCAEVYSWGMADSPAKLKSILSLVDAQRLLDDNMVRLTHWIARQYLCSVGQVFEAMLPAGVRSQAGTRLTTVFFASDDLDKRLAVLDKKSREDDGIEPTTGRKRKALLTPKQVRVLEILRQSEEPLTSNELLRAGKCSAGIIGTLKRLGLIRARTVRRHQPQVATPIKPDLELDPHQLNPDQRRALDTIAAAVRESRHETFLLHGVTGSGKTEVYIQAIHEVVRRGKQAIVLVPEISLTPQTVGRFQSRFSDVAVLHSHLTDAERHHQWSNIAQGSVQVVVGARSAVFAPLPRLGLIVIDEEHENSFKQDSVPRYHARDVARKRAEDLGVPLILGSATPSMESWHAAATEKSDTLISMPRRVGTLRLPKVDIVDLREEIRSQSTRGAIHRQLHSAIRDALKEDGQIILLLNRRGFSTHIQCPACGEAMKCPNCDVTLTHHRSEDIVLCHYCDYQDAAPRNCVKCGFDGIRYSGFGTQKLETEIKARFPEASVLRMDTDTMQGRGAHERALAKFRAGNVQILLGTQMIAKGLDFPNVTLVGVINADTALHLPDFRAFERTFHLITQVAGRTGRGEKGGRVIVQTFSPDHPAIQAAAEHDYRGFVAQELAERQLVGYPPFTKMIRIVIRGENEANTLRFATDMAAKLKEKKADPSLRFRALGPAPAPFAKLRGFFRFHLHLHAVNGDWLRDRVREVTLALKTPREIQWIVDVDPVDML